MEDYLEDGICSICGGEYHHFGNNAEPVNSGRCCDECNDTVVLPERLKYILSNRRGD